MLKMSEILVLCTANLCRSVMAQSLLARHIADRLAVIPSTLSSATVHVSSAGILGRGDSPPPEVITVMASRNCVVTGHRSRIVTPDDLAGADLVIGMAREHVRHAVVISPSAWPRTFTFRELVRRGRLIGSRVPGESLAGWLARIAPDRDRRTMLGASSLDDIADPTGGPLRGYEDTATVIDQLARELTALYWPA